MKLYRIVHHQRSVYPEDLLLNPKEHPTVKKGNSPLLQTIAKFANFNSELQAT